VARLKRVDCSQPGITRRRRGRGFEYIEVDGTRVSSHEALARIRELAVPPAWTAVWICGAPNGHPQATGIDAAGRKQYLYHPQWRERRDQQHDSYGLAMLLKSHVSIEPDAVRCDYVAKSGQRRVQVIDDPDVLRILTKLKRRRGVKKVAGSLGNTPAVDINQYVKEATGGDFSRAPPTSTRACSIVTARLDDRTGARRDATMRSGSRASRRGA
jgi:DNA topoisomerase IB